jgi:neutral ceramidase
VAGRQQSGDRIISMKKVIKWTFKIIAGVLLFCLLLAPFLFTKVDRTPYQQLPYYTQMMKQLDTFQLDTLGSQGNYFKAGWAKKNITPTYMPDLAGYGLRDKASCLHDSVFVRAFVFDNGKRKAVFLSADLLIFPPVLEERIKAKAVELGYEPTSFFFSATHTHSAPGGWAERPAGRVLAGAYNEEYVQQLLTAILEVLRLAEANKEEAETGFGIFEAGSFVRNRLNEPDSETDPWIRVLKVKKKTGAEAAIIVYSAHANCLKMDYHCISGDYPAAMIHKLEKEQKLDFAMYASGMVGSHTPKPIYEQGKEMENEPLIHAYADSLANIIGKGIDSIPMKGVTSLNSAVLELPLREPHLKISRDWRVRPWLFDWAFGPYYPKIKILKINKVVFMGMPCDFSGELMKDLQPLCDEKNIQLVITSFNGGYIGYINVDRYYDKNKAETRDMNWFGPYNQAYFTEIIRKILRKV